MRSRAALSTSWILAAASLGAAAVLLPGSARGAESNSLLALSRDGRRLAAVNRDNGTVSIVDVAGRTVLREIPVGHKPESAAWLGDSSRIAVAVYADDEVVVADAERGEIVHRIPVFDEPYGLVANADGTRIYATLEYPGQVAEIDPAAGKLLRTWEVGPFLRGIGLAEGEGRLYVTEYLSGVVHAVDLATGSRVDRWAGVASENLARQIALHPTRPKAYVPHIRSRVNVNRGEGSVVPFVSVVDTAAGEGRRRKPIPMDSFASTFVVANPWEAAISADGRRFAVVFAGTDDMYLCHVVDDDYREISPARIVRLGHNPRAVRFSPDGRELYVYNTLDFEVAVVDAERGRTTARIKVCENPLGEEMLLGKRLFYSALEPMVGRRWISCASCHPDGDPDGRTWQNPEGLRNTTGLAGMAWTHPIHWSADRDEVQDFEITIRSELMQGRGLIRGPVHEGLGVPNAGRSAELDALALYSNSHAVPLSPHAKNGLSEAAQRGRALFHAEQVGCAACHGGAYYTDSRPEPPFKLHDVGTGADDPSEKMGPKYDTPTLLGVYRTAPYLHHGKAATLEEVLTKYNPDDKHGRTSHLSKDEIADLVEFLKALPYEDPEPGARAEGLRKIEK
jgi:YVTN family beta-propeller protein